ncbi:MULTISPECIES: GTPase [Staphylococcus]|uniref:GTPase n=1 Tax=Staphylococcus TaxID=1279 RepID=UPI001AEBC621|nr:MULTISPECIES: GTPase [Staphylococcus]MEB8089657.1 50S ribosome-binding GTPase [Staphylococcus saprophyticus]
MAYIKDYEIFLKNQFKNTLHSLKKISNITSVDIKNDEVRKSLNEMNKSIKNSINKVEKEINNLENNMAWEKLNIAFFGETNAGKSTIIEALIHGDGSTIGDGRKDYTKNLTFNTYKDVNLIDLPGMEGNEEKYIEEIKKGINKAHIVFYVSPSSKEPEEKSLIKIKKYLKDQANIYSIVNVRRPLNSRTRDTLMDENINIVVKRTNEKFKQIFGGFYKGNITMNAKLGYISRSVNKNKEIQDDRKKFIKTLGDIDEVYRYSNFNQIIQKINQINNKTKEKEIGISNTYKFISLNEEITSNILKSKKDLDKQISEIERNFDKAKNEIQNEIKDFEIRVKKTLKVEISKFQNEVKELVVKTNEEKLKQENTEIELKNIEKRFIENFKSELENEFEELRRRILNNYTQMKDQINLNVKYTKFENSLFDVEDLMRKFTWNFNKIIKNMLDLALTIISSIPINPILAVLNVSISVVMKFFKWKNVDKVDNQKKKVLEIYKDIDHKIENIEFEINKKIKSKINEFQNDIQKENSKVDLYIGNIKRISYSMSDQIAKLINIKSNVSRKLLEYVEETKIEFAHIDYGLRSILFIGETLKDNYIYNLKHIKQYKNIQEFYFDYEHKIKDKYILLKPNEEFQKRSLSELINHLKYKYKKTEIKGVRRLKNDNK